MRKTHVPQPPYSPAWSQPAPGTYVPTPRPAPRRPRWAAIVGITFVVLAALCVAGTIIAGVSSAGSHPGGKPNTFVSLPAAGAAAPAPAPAGTSAGTFGKSDIKLSVKILKQDCFDTAGANVQWKIVAAVDFDALHAAGGDYDVTYEVRGLEDAAAVSTLTVHQDGTYDQDEGAFGQTKTCHVKLSAKVTSVDPA